VQLGGEMPEPRVRPCPLAPCAAGKSSGTLPGAGTRRGAAAAMCLVDEL